MWHCKEFNVEIVGVSNKPKNISPEKKRSDNEHMEKCVVSMITIERKDVKTKNSNLCAKEIIKFVKDTGSKNIVLMPFVHLSNKIADSDNALGIIKEIEKKLRKYKILKSHFGYHKELLLHTFGHKTNVRYREF